MVERIPLPRDPETVLQLASILEDRAVKAEAEAARLCAENERLTAERAETEQERAAAFEDADQASESARRFEKIGMEWKVRALAAEAREAKAVEDMRERAALKVKEMLVYADTSTMQDEAIIAAVRALPTEAQNNA